MARTYQVLRSKTGRKGMRVCPSVDVEELRRGLRLFSPCGREEYVGRLAELMVEAAEKARRSPGAYWRLEKWQDPEHVAEALRVAGWLYDEQESARATAVAS